VGVKATRVVLRPSGKPEQRPIVVQGEYKDIRPPIVTGEESLLKSLDVEEVHIEGPRERPAKQVIPEEPKKEPVIVDKNEPPLVSYKQSSFISHMTDSEE
jgi:hypothetical protein